jgi:hypothetical protein
MDWILKHLLQARKIWANFYFFITRITTYKDTGHTINEAIAYFEAERGDRTVNHLHKSLQEKKLNRKRAIDIVD